MVERFTVGVDQAHARPRIGFVLWGDSLFPSTHFCQALPPLPGYTGEGMSVVPGRTAFGFVGYKW